MEDLKWLYGTTQGRIGRWKYFVWGAVPGIISLLLDKTVDNPLITLPVALAVIWMNICVSAKRCHDLGRSGWWMILLFLPIANLIFGLYLLFAPGEQGSNAYGEPHEPGAAPPAAPPPAQPPAQSA
jgi:uncharacterized membrane protein YhaH (DUF805 family)